jgi:D-inositol-3-phosphate glycosyltransferase
VTGAIDQPSPGAGVPAGTVRVSGWAAHGGRPVVAVFVRVEGAGPLTPAEATMRPDVAEHFGDAAATACGYVGTVDLAAYAGDEGRSLDLEVIVLVDRHLDAPLDGSAGRDLGGATLELLGSVTVTIAPPATDLRGRMDLPPAGAALGRHPCLVVGWAASDAAPAGGVEVLVDGVSAGLARLCLPRPDLVDAGAPHMGLAGYEQWVDLSDLPVDHGEVGLTVRAWVAGGEPETIADGRFALTPPRSCRPEDGSRVGDRPSLPRARRVSREQLDLCVFAHSLDYGGAQLWLSELLQRAGAGRDFPCTVVTPLPGPLAAQFEGSGMTVQVTQPYPLTDTAGYQGRLAEVSAWLAGRDHNVVLVNTIVPFLPADAASALGLPVVWAVHESWAPSQLFSQFYEPGSVAPGVQASFRRAMWNAAALVFEAEATRRLYEGAAAPERTVVCHWGVDIAAIDAYRSRTTRRSARRAVGLPEDARALLVVGSIEPRKSQTMIAEAFGQVAGDFPDAFLVFVGDNGSPYSGALRRYLADAGLADRARVVPVIADVYPWYRAADLLLSASDVESLQRAVMEAMCFGVPVAATAIFGLPELLTDGETGFLFPPRDLGRLVATLRRVLGAAPEELAGVASAARRLAEQRCDSSGYAADLMALFQGLLAEPAALPADLLRAARRRP